MSPSSSDCVTASAPKPMQRDVGPKDFLRLRSSVA
jgi:hypothetical protein